MIGAKAFFHFRNKGLVGVSTPRSVDVYGHGIEETRIGNRYGAKTSSSLRMVMENHFDARRRTMRDFPRFAKTVLVRFSLLDFWIPADIIFAIAVFKVSSV